MNIGTLPLMHEKDTTYFTPSGLVDGEWPHMSMVSACMRVYAYQMLEEVINVVTDGLHLAAFKLLKRRMLGLVHPFLFKRKNMICDY